MLKSLLEWAYLNLWLLRAAHVPGILNQGAVTSLQRSGYSTHRWFRKSGRSLARQRSTSSPQKTTLTAQFTFQIARMHWPTIGPTSSCMVFPSIVLIPQEIRRIRDHKRRVLLVAPLWRNQLWFSELSQLLTAAPWSIPLSQDLSGEQDDLASPTRVVGSAPLGSQCEMS